ncbi:MAG: hypothetical protein ACAH95_10545 [Fimbriimonas sp.]
MTTLLIASLLTSPVLSQRPSEVPTGFRDEMRSLVPWTIYNKERPPAMTVTSKGIKMTLPHVPEGWPYAYQWSGARRKITLDVARYGRLVADVPEITKGSYAHFEIAVLDAKDQEVKGFRSESVTEPGQIQFDLSTQLLPATYRLDVRLIVGGSNEGASATYRWVKAFSSNPSRG